MRLAAGQQDEGYEGGEATVEDRHPHVKDGCLGSLLPGARDGEEGMTHVDRVVDTQTDGNDDVDGADHVNGDVPGVHEPAQVHQAEGDGEEDQDGAKDICQEDQGGQEDTGKGNAKVPEQLSGDHFIRLPVGIFLIQYLLIIYICTLFYSSVECNCT